MDGGSGHAQQTAAVQYLICLGNNGCKTPTQVRSATGQTKINDANAYFHGTGKYSTKVYPVCSVGYRIGTREVTGTFTHSCKVAAHRLTTYYAVVSATGGFDHMGVGEPATFWAWETSPTVGAALSPLTGVRCSATTEPTSATHNKTSRTVHFTVSVHKTKGVKYAATWVYGVGLFSTGQTNWTLTYTYPTTLGPTLPKLGTKFTPVATVYGRLTLTGTDKLYSESENCTISVHLTGKPTTTTTGLGTTTSISAGTGTTNLAKTTPEVTGGCANQKGGFFGLVQDLATPVNLVICPLEYLFVPSKGAVGKWDGVVGGTSNATNGSTQPASQWLVEIAKTAVQAPTDVYNGLHTAAGECVIPSAQLPTTPASAKYTFCTGYTAAVSEIGAHGNGTTWVVVVGDVMGTIFSLFMLIALWYFMMSLAAKTQVGANSEPPAHSGGGVGI